MKRFVRRPGNGLSDFFGSTGPEPGTHRRYGGRHAFCGRAARPVGLVLEEFDRPNGLHLTKRTVPIGVIAVIYEARPNVTADSAALCLKSGNTVILRGGKEAIHSNLAIASVLRSAIAEAGLSADCVQLIEDTDRATAHGADAAQQRRGSADSRGGAGLIQSVVKNATVPVIETGAGTCQTYVDKDADLAMAVDIVDNAKTSRPSVCNACECVRWYTKP